MYSARLYVTGSNYEINSDKFLVPNMYAERKKFIHFVKERGGSHREHILIPQKSHNLFAAYPGHYKRLSFRDEFFLDGVIITLSGTTLKSDRYFFSASRKDIRGAMKAEGGVLLAHTDQFFEYDRKRRLGFIEQEPELSHAGSIELTLEGSVKHLVEDLPEFSAVTGLPEEWPLPLRLEAAGE